MKNRIILSCLLFFFAGAVELYALGGKVLSKAVEETLELAAKRSGRVLIESAKIPLRHSLLKIAAKYGDDVLPLVRKGGLEVLEQGARHGDDFWRLCKAVPEASRSLALHTDELLPLAKRIGPDVLRVEAAAPGMATRIVREFGDDGIHLLAGQPSQDVSRLLGYAAKTNNPEARKLLYETYAKSQHKSTFLEALNKNWKVIMAGGLTTAAIVSAYKISDGIQEGLKNSDAAESVVNRMLAPLRYGLYALLLIFLVPLGIKSARWSIAAWKKKSSQNNP